jgi:hypothetical protein
MACGLQRLGRQPSERKMMQSRMWFAVVAATVLPVGLVLAPTSAAQDSEEIETALLDPAARSLSATDLETFADIYADLEKTSTEYEMELATVVSESEARNLQTRMQRESRRKIEQRGWTEEKYEEVNETVNSSPVLLERALALINERS